MLKIKLFATLAIIVIACSTLATAASNQKIDKSLYSDIKSVIGERLNKIDNDNGNILVVFESGHYRTNDIIGWSAGYDSRLVFMQLAKRNNYNSVTCIATHSGS